MTTFEIIDTLHDFTDISDPALYLFPWSFWCVFYEPNVKDKATQTDPCPYCKLGQKVATNYGSMWKLLLSS